MALAAGFFLKGLPNDAAKVGPLNIHITLGRLILFLMIAHLVTRFITKRPPPSDTGSALLNKGAGLVHALLYIAAITMAVAGMGTAVQAGLNVPGTSPPEDFLNSQYATDMATSLSSLLVLIALHVGAWAFHQFFKKDNLFARLWFGKQ